MRCTELTNDLLLDYADWQLPPHERNRVARHLEGCSPCQIRRDDLEGMAGALRHAQELPPPGLLKELDSSVLDGLTPRYDKMVRPFRHIAAAVAAALLLALGVFLILRAPQDPAAANPALTLQPPSTPSPVSHPPTLTGDLNGDGEVDIADARMIQQIVLTGLPPPPQADVNGDGAVDIADVRLLTHHAVASR